MIFTIFITVLLGFAFSEFVGYWLHMLLHSNKIEFLSKSHMLHHLKLYGPKDEQVTDDYWNSADNRADIAGIGMEWVIPITIVVGLLFVSGWALAVRWIYQCVFVGAAVAWGYFLFDYMHSALHIKGIWFERSSLFKQWFMRARRLHILHHDQLSDEGLMNKNYGICFFFFDKVFGTFLDHRRPFNGAGYHAAQKRYAYIFKLG